MAFLTDNSHKGWVGFTGGVHGTRVLKQRPTNFASSHGTSNANINFELLQVMVDTRTYSSSIRNGFSVTCVIRRSRAETISRPTRRPNTRDNNPSTVPSAAGTIRTIFLL